MSLLTCDNEASRRDATNVTDGSNPPIRYERRRAGVSLPSEEWRDVPGYEGIYLVSNLGRVRSVPRPRTRGGLLKQPPSDRGYPSVTLYGDGHATRVGVHRLVAAAFLVAECPGLQVRHLDGNPANNVLSNLAYGTQSENEFDKIRHGRNRNKTKTHCRRGHSYADPQHVYVTTRGHRSCRTCENDARRGNRGWQPPARQVACPDCGVSVGKNNLPRHRMRNHLRAAVAGD